MKTQRFDIKFHPSDSKVYTAIETVRKGRGMTRKGFVMHAIANTYPELTEPVVNWLMRSKTNRKAAEETLKHEK